MGKIDGHIIDIYPDYRENRIISWLKNTKGKTVRISGNLQPEIYVQGEYKRLKELMPERAALFENFEGRLLNGKQHQGLSRITFEKFSDLAMTAHKINLNGSLKDFKLYNVDIDLTLRYFTENHMSPFTQISVENRGSHNPLFKLLEDPWETDYPLPPLKEVSLSLEVEKRRPIPTREDPIKSLTLNHEDECMVLDGDEENIILELANAIQWINPDVIYTVKGDEIVLPYLYYRAEKNGLSDKLHMGREKTTYQEKSGKSYFSYGRIIYRPQSHSLTGRIHMDRSSFMFQESGIDGLADLSRISAVPVQRLSRVSPGNAVTSMYLKKALEKGVLVPWKIQNPEDFKTARQLLLSDRGGYIFEPVVGIHENVVELDFVSLFPNIMRKYNISPETILCRCCPDSSQRVPVLDYNICEKRRGLVPQVLEPLIERRLHFKKMRDSYSGNMKEIYNQRQAILKWLLVTSFGYMGYRNSRFGRIEGHESITAFGREIILTAKEVAESMGFQVLHGIVDSLWVKKDAPTEDFLVLADMISREVGISMEMEGRYRWIVFLPNKSSGVGALNRYYGLFEKGKIKVRGVDIRLRNTPPVIKKFSEDVLELFSRAQDAHGLMELLPDSLDILRSYLNRMESGIVNPRDLVFTIRISKKIDDYRQRNLTLAALKQMKHHGIQVNPGQKIKYIVTDSKAPKHIDRVKVADMLTEKESCDWQFYSGLLVRCLANLISVFGYTERSIWDLISREKQQTLFKYMFNFIETTRMEKNGIQPERKQLS